MTAKTILVQLHHKIETFEGINKHLALVVQNPLIEYMQANFNFGQFREARLGDSMHIHGYDLTRSAENNWRIELATRLSTDVAGVSASLGLQADARVELSAIIALLEEKLSDTTLYDFTKPISDVTPMTPPS